MSKKCDDIITCAGSGHHLRPDRIGIIKEMPGSVASGTLCIFQLEMYKVVLDCSLLHYLTNREKYKGGGLP